MQLATQTYLERQIQINFGTDPDPVAEQLLIAASRIVVRELGFDIPVPAAAATEIYTGRTGESRLHLRRFPVTAITSVSERGTALTASQYRLIERNNGSRTLQRLVGDYTPGEWDLGAGAISIDYTAGYATEDDVLPEIQSVTAAIAARAFKAGARFAAAAAEAGSGSIRSITLEGSDSIEFDMNAIDRDVYLTDTDRSILRGVKGMVFA